MRLYLPNLCNTSSIQLLVISYTPQAKLPPSISISSTPLLAFFALSAVCLLRAFDVAMNTFVVVLCSWLLYRLWVAWLYPKYLSPLKHLPQLKVDEEVSAVSRTLLEPTSQQIHRRLQATPNASVGLVRFKGMLGGDRVIVTDDKALGEVLRHPDLYEIPPHRRSILGHLTGDGLFYSTGETHKHQRKNLASAFAQSNIRNYYGIFWSKATELAMFLSKQPKDASGSLSVDMHAWAGRLSMDDIGVAAFGTDFGLLADDQTEFNTKYVKAFGQSRIIELRYMAAILLPGWLFELLPLSTKSLREAVAFVRAKCTECVGAARQAMQSEKKPSFHFDTICDVALASNAFSDRNLEDQLMTILAAGHHTSKCGLTVTVTMLCQHQEVQTRLRTEIASLLSTSASTETSDVVNKIMQLPYLQAVCRESLRLLPPLPVLRRRTTQPTTLLNYSIPKHTLLVLSPWIVHRDPKHWGPDADEFRPDRWLDSGATGGGSLGKHSLLTFLHGPRNCIGQVFAGAELAITVAVLVSRFQLGLGRKVPVWEEEVVLKPHKDTAEVVLTPIQ